MTDADARPPARPRTLRVILHGKQATNPAVRAAVDEVRAAGHRVDVRVTWECGDARTLAAEAARARVDAVVAGGGDGTVNEVVAGVLSVPRARPSVGVLPLGTANDFARSAGVPVDDLTAALRLVAEGEAVPVDVGRVGDRTFMNVATGGFGTEITAETSPELKQSIGRAAYFVTGILRFTDLAAKSARLRGPGLDWEGPFWALAVGNGRQAGGGVQLCPEAVLDDGLLDVAVLPEPTTGGLPGAMAALVTRGLSVVSQDGLRWQVPWLEVEAPSGIQINLDGEPIEGTAFRFEVLKGKLRFHLPPASPVLRAVPGGLQTEMPSIITQGLAPTA